jgi:hypothetical protein
MTVDPVSYEDLIAARDLCRKHQQRIATPL